MFEGGAILADEGARQAAVDGADIRTKRWDKRLQDIAERAAAIARTPMAAVSIIDRSRNWLAAKTGPMRDEVPRAISFCALAIRQPGEVMVVADATRDARFVGNPLVEETPSIRFYVGVPLVDRAGYPLGALCVIDHALHDEMPDLYDLTALAREAERIIAQPV